MSRFSDYQGFVEANGGAVLDWKHELVDPDGQLLATTDMSDAVGNVELWGASLDPIDFEGGQISQRTGTMRIPDRDAGLLPVSPGDMLHPDTANRVRTYAGIVGADGETTWWTQSTLLVQQVESVGVDDQAAELVVDLTDTLRPVLSDLATTFTHDRDEPTEDVVRRLLAEVVPEASIAETGFVVPGGSLPAGTDRFEAVDVMLEGCGHELVADSMGRVSSRPIPPSDLDDLAERWRYGVDGIPVTGPRRIIRAHTPQGVRVEGGSLRTAASSATLIVYDQDPTSEGYFDGPGEAIIPSVSYPYAETTPQLATAGYAQLRRIGRGPAVVTFQTIPNPAMMEGDQLSLNMPAVGVDGEFRVLAYRLPVEVDGLMTVTARAVYDPALNYDSPAAADGSTCLATISDSFDRPDENLEDSGDPIGSDPGSPDWTEHGYSWGVVNGNAIQRFDQGWSLAYVNTPLCSSDQTVTVEISSVPGGRRIGPVVRTSGAFEGYAALVNSSGQVRIEMWLNGSAVEVLDSSSNTGNPVGKSLSLAIVGTSLVARLNGDVVASATDGRLTGSHVGMLAYGGSPSNAPGVASFSAAQAT